jgi:hypothetical protein
VTHCDIMLHFDMFVTLKVFKLIGPYNDGERHGRGTYLFGIVSKKNYFKINCYSHKSVSQDANGNLDPEAPATSTYNYGRRRSRAVLYQLSGHYKTDKSKKIHSKLSTNVSKETRFVHLK